MHARELVELAAEVAAHGAVLIHAAPHISKSSLEDYWSTSKCRHDCWGRELKLALKQMQLPDKRQMPWKTLAPLVEEILAGEVLTRVWSALTASHDRFHGTNELEPISRSILIGHMEARNRALNLLVYGQGVGMEQAVTLNRLRGRVERWTDVLLSLLQPHGDVSEFGFDRERVREFADDLAYERRQGQGEHAREMLLASLRASFQQGMQEASPNSVLNRRIATSILAAFPGDVFDSTGHLKSLWMVRMNHAAADTAGLLADLIALEDTPSSRLAARGTQPRF